MAESKTAVVVFFLVALVVAAASVPAASADACTDDCYKRCDNGKNDPACTNTCDEKCRIEAATHEYAAAKPAEKKAVAGELRTQSDGAVAAATTDKKAAYLATSCIDICYDRCGKDKKDPACTARCESVCRAEVDSLSFAADMYAAATPAEKAIVIMSLDKQANEPEGKIKVLSAKCISECNKYCNNPICAAFCDDGCYTRAASVAFAMATPPQKDAIYRDIDNAEAKKAGAA